MDEKKPFAICEALKVGLGERFRFRGKGYRVSDAGVVLDGTGRPASGLDICNMVNSPGEIGRGLTDGERTVMRSLGARFATMDEAAPSGYKVDLWSDRPSKWWSSDGIRWEGDGWLALVNSDLFPTVALGECWSDEASEGAGEKDGGEKGRCKKVTMNATCWTTATSAAATGTTTT